METPLRVLIADDSFVVRGGLRNFVQALEGFEVVGEAVSGREAIAMAQERRPDVVLMDLRMRDGDGIAATREIAHSVPAARTIVVTWSDEPEHVREAIAAGAKGYLVHGRFGADQLSQALRTVAEGGAIIAPSLASEIIAEAKRTPGDPSRLTPREIEILTLVQRGRTNREIGAELGIEEKTVKNHINSIYSKLNISSRFEAMASATKRT
ncbi:MAG TPA: response regulator transcription factor [Candidatus Dormibacteraeota bacterium]|nr:response regulator transcription factor [Candidatus Dormibacteraeota bacterium]